MIEIIDKFLDKHGLTTADNTFLVGFSGGCDSLCLLDILHEFSKKYGFKVVALHVNHNWRKEESLREELNCKKFCEQNNIEFISKTLDGNGQKSENIAREARYAFFLEYAKMYPNSSIFTGHTSSDNAETIIYRIIKGTGIKGLQGILPERKLGDTFVFRPLLQLSRRRTEDYCHSKGLIPNTDSSNFDINYKRNFIRHKIMPLFDEINFNAEKSINSLAKLAASNTKIVNEYIAIVMKEVYVDKKLLTDKFRNLSQEVMKQIIYNACLRYNLDYDSKKIDNILDFVKNNFDSKSGSRYSLTNDLWIFANSKYIYLITKTKGDKNDTEITIKTEGEWIFSEGNPELNSKPDLNLESKVGLPAHQQKMGNALNATQYKVFSLEKYEGGNDFKFPSENALFAYVNLEDVGLNLTLRTRREGDFITPFGMNGKMKLKKYLNSKKVPQHEKDELILLCKDSEVLWAVGVGLSNKLKVVNKPTHVIELKIKEY